MTRLIVSALLVTAVNLLAVTSTHAHTPVEAPEGSYPAYWSNWGASPYWPYYYPLFSEEERTLLRDYTHSDPYGLAESICRRRNDQELRINIGEGAERASFACGPLRGGSISRIVLCPEGETETSRHHGDHRDYFCIPPEVEQSKQLCDPADQCNGTNPINLATGNKHQRERDYRGGGTFPLKFERYFNSSASPIVDINAPSFRGYIPNQAGRDRPYTLAYDFTARRPAPTGARWSHSYNRAVEALGRASVAMARVHRPDGRVYRYELVDGEWETDADVTGRLERLGNGAGWRYIENDVTEIFDANGRLVSLTDRAGRRLIIAHDANGRLVSVTDDFGRSLSFTYRSDDGLLKTMTDPGGGVYSYDYDEFNNLVHVGYPDGTERGYVYEEGYGQSRLVRIIDETGEAMASWTYDQHGRAIASSHAGGAESMEVEYRDGNTTEITDERGVTRTYQFIEVQGSRRLASVSGGQCVRCGSTAKSISYDSNGFVSGKVDFNGVETRYEHNVRGLEISRTEAAGTPEQRTITTEWHPDFRLPTRITEPGRVTEHHYDANGNRLTTTITDTATGESRTTSWTYNDYGQVLTVDGPRNDVSDVTTYTYDAQGNVSTITNALGHQTQYTDYDAHGNPLRIVDANGVVTELEYDLRQRLVSRTVAAGTTDAATTTFTYDPVGQLIETVLPNGASINYEYDAAHRLVAIADNLGNRIDYTLDASGNRINETVSGPVGNVFRETSREYNTLNRLVVSIGGEGQRTTYTYDADGNRTGVTDAHGNSTTNRYDALDRLFETVDALGGVTRYQYDPKDNLSQVVDPRGVTTGYTYNGFSELTETASPDAGTTTYAYDKAGNRINQTDARGITVDYQYDALNRLVVIDYPEPVDGSPSKDITYTYDDGANGIGRLSRIDDETGSTDYYYGPRGNLVSKVSIVDGVTLPVDYSYDAADNIATQRYPSGATVDYQRDAAGRVTGLELVQVDGSRVALLSGIGYAPFGPITGMSYGNGITETRSFDRDGRITGIQSHVQDLGYTWNAVNNITGIADHLDSTKSQNFSYDALYHLTAATGAYGNLDWQYDAVGNRTAQAADGTSTNYSYESLSNRLAAIDGPDGSSNYQYDETGNTLSDGDSSYSYDTRNRLTTAVIPAQAGTRYEYAHNALGQRVVKPRFQTVEPGDSNGDGIIDENDLHTLRDIIKGNIPATAGADCNQDGNIDNKDVSCIANQIGGSKNNGKKNRSPVHAEREPGQTFNTTSTSGTNTIAGNILFAYDEAGHLIGEYDESGEVIREYIWLGDRPVAMIDSNGSIHYIHSDHLNTPKVVTDENQTVAWKGDYSPFGEVEEVVSTIEFNLRFPGQFYDAETGLNYNYFRSYDASTGRYTQSDPIGLSGGANLYSYVSGNPISRFDRRGLDWKSATEYFKCLMNGGNNCGQDYAKESAEELAEAANSAPGILADKVEACVTCFTTCTFQSFVGHDAESISLNATSTYGSFRLGQTVEAISATTSSFTVKFVGRVVLPAATVIQIGDATFKTIRCTVSCD